MVCQITGLVIQSKTAVKKTSDYYCSLFVFFSTISNSALFKDEAASILLASRSFSEVGHFNSLRISLLNFLLRLALRQRRWSFEVPSSSAFRLCLGRLANQKGEQRMIAARALCALTTVIAGAVMVMGAQTNKLQIAISGAQVIILMGIAWYLALADRRNP